MNFIRLSFLQYSMKDAFASWDMLWTADSQYNVVIKTWLLVGNLLQIRSGEKYIIWQFTLVPEFIYGCTRSQPMEG